MSCSCWQADLAAARAGDHAALGRLLDALRSYLRHIAGDEIPAALHAKSDEADLVQETFLEATRTFDRFRGATADELRVWTRGILRHLLGHFRRAYGRQRRRACREVSLEGAGTVAGFARGLVAREPPPDEQLAERETWQTLEAAVERLPERYRLVVGLRTRENRPFDEIARALGITADAAPKRWTRAVNRLAREVKRKPS